MAIPTSELQSINPSSIIDLFMIELNILLHGKNETFRFHAGTNQLNESIVIDDVITDLKVVEIRDDFIKLDGKFEIKKGDSINVHIHKTFHVILYLTDGCDLKIMKGSTQ